MELHMHAKRLSKVVESLSNRSDGVAPACDIIATNLIDIRLVAQ